jgi:uncharacterized membrane protein YagU involved in acid resistance
MRNQINGAVWGALAGVAGGLAMTGMVHKVAPRVIPEDMQPDEFVPKKAVEWAEEKVNGQDTLSESQEMKVAMGGHLAYSALAGSLYGLARQHVADDIPAPVAGALFGVAVWGLSFEGWMPAVGIMERTTDQPPKKWPAPVMGHIIYGVTTALAYKALERLTHRESNQTPRKSPDLSASSSLRTPTHSPYAPNPRRRRF